MNKENKHATRLLLVDTDAMLRGTLCLVFRDAGYEVHQASNGFEALKIHRRQPVDVVIAEMVLPVKDGFQTMMELRRDSVAPKFIAIAGSRHLAAEVYLRTAEVLGAHRILAKPFEPGQLLAMVQQVLDTDKQIPPPVF